MRNPLTRLYQRVFKPNKQSVEVYQATVATGTTGKPTRRVFHLGENTWRERCQHFDLLAEEYPLFNQSCLALAGMVMSQGAFHKAAVNKQDDTYPLAEEAKWRCEKLGRDMRINSRFYETVLKMAKYGGCFWEATFTPSFGVRLAPRQEHIEPAEMDKEGNITRWRQVIHGTVVAEWSATPTRNGTYLINIPWNVTPNTWPYGASLGTGSETELSALIEMERDAQNYMEKQAWPYEVLALGNEKSHVLESDYSHAKNQWRNREPGEGIVTRNMPVNIIPGGTGSSPIRELAVLCQLMKDNAHDGLMVAPISKLYNSTEASAKVLTKHIMTTLGQPMQWIIKEAYEEYVLKPFLEHASFSVKSCPNVLFESPDVHKTEEGEYWSLLVERQIQTPKQAADHLGLEYDEEYWTKEQERMLQQAQAHQQPDGEEEGKSYRVTELYKHRRSSQSR